MTDGDKDFSQAPRRSLLPGRDAPRLVGGWLGGGALVVAGMLTALGGAITYVALTRTYFVLTSSALTRGGPRAGLVASACAVHAVALIAIWSDRLRAGRWIEMLVHLAAALSVGYVASGLVTPAGLIEAGLPDWWGGHPVKFVVAIVCIVFFDRRWRARHTWGRATPAS